MSRVLSIRRDEPSPVVESLVRHNTALLEQGAAVLAGIDDDVYPSVGAHFRHCLDFYQCLLDGLQRGVIDHTRRLRDVRVEQHRQFAIESIGEAIARLQTGAASAGRDLGISLVLDHDPSRVVRSTVERELEAAASHTIHHFAVIGVLLRTRGVEVPDDFGVAPSTLRFRART